MINTDRTMRPYLLLPALALAAGIQAQDINAYRYWYDDATADAVTTTVAPAAELSLNTTLPTGAMAAGYHRLSIQFRDTDGKWSAPHTQLFTRSSTTANGYRYWLNDDPSTLVEGTITAGATVDLNTALATSTGDRLFNLVTIQFQESDGLFSAPITKAYTRGTGEVNGYEYWIDDAIADRVSNTLGPAAVVDLIADLPLSLTQGEHVLTIRFSTEQGTWSVPLSATFSFVVGIEELPGISDLLLFPNPATDQLGLRLNSTAAHTLRLEILDVSGQRIRDIGPWGVHGTNWKSWDISDLAKGTYFLRIQGEHGSWSTRFVKQ